VSSGPTYPPHCPYCATVHEGGVEVVVEVGRGFAVVLEVLPVVVVMVVEPPPPTGGHTGGPGTGYEVIVFAASE
jgi:hypothetical protein